MMTRAKIYDITGKDCLIMRPPYGACNDDVKAVAKTLGVSFINWSVDTLDWKTKNADAVYNEIIDNVSDGAIILCHDLHKTTVDAMERVIPKLISEGYQLVTVSQLMEYSEKQLEPGKLYYRQ
jgi:peptidoglycan/xylan/chitin deacetylase (PgdA/CDA1 family)